MGQRDLGMEIKVAIRDVLKCREKTERAIFENYKERLGKALSPEAESWLNIQFDEYLRGLYRVGEELDRQFSLKKFHEEMKENGWAELAYETKTKIGEKGGKTNAGFPH